MSISSRNGPNLTSETKRKRSASEKLAEGKKPKLNLPALIGIRGGLAERLERVRQDRVGLGSGSLVRHGSAQLLNGVPGDSAVLHIKKCSKRL